MCYSNCKILDSVVLEIMGFKGVFSDRKVAKMFNVSRTAIRRIFEGKRRIHDDN